MTHEAIILCRGHSQRLKPHSDVSKPLLKLEPNLTLLDYQIPWLQKNCFKRSILASKEQPLTGFDVEYSLETENLGTGGALKKAAEKCVEQYVYAMNVDDILLGNYNPTELVNYAERGGAIVIAKSRLQFGRVQVEDCLITGCVQKPQSEFFMSTGHYTFETEVIRKHFSRKGNFEKKTSPRLPSLRCSDLIHSTDCG